MSAIDHDEARRIASGLGKSYQFAGDAETKLVFDAYLEAVATCLRTAEERALAEEERDAARARGDFYDRQAKKYRDRSNRLRDALADLGPECITEPACGGCRNCFALAVLAETKPTMVDLRNKIANAPEATPEEMAQTERIATEQMNDAQKKHAGETHSDHCWARLAWGDGECECKGLPAFARADDVDALISESSLGSPEAVALREQTPPGVAERIVARAEEISAAAKKTPKKH